MPSRAVAPPTSARVEIGVGGALAFTGAVILVVHLGSIPGFIAELVIGFVDVPAFWPMVGGAVLLAVGMWTLLRGRRALRRHARAVVRIAAMQERAQQQLPRGAGGVSPGVGGTPHRAPRGFSTATPPRR